MKRYIILCLITIFCGNIFAQMPENGDYSAWNWENQDTNNWKRKRNGEWMKITPPFSSEIDKSGLMYNIYINDDYTYDKGWRIIHANFIETYPYFILYNEYNSIVRGFIYLEGAEGSTDFNYIMMSIEPNNEAKKTKTFHLSEKNKLRSMIRHLFLRQLLLQLQLPEEILGLH